MTKTLVDARGRARTKLWGLSYRLLPLDEVGAYDTLEESENFDANLVPPGQISQNTLDFLAQLMKPECNDREWYACRPCRIPRSQRLTLARFKLHGMVLSFPLL